jgi:hypothetical protein
MRAFLLLGLGESELTSALHHLGPSEITVPRTFIQELRYRRSDNKGVQREQEYIDTVMAAARLEITAPSVPDALRLTISQESKI